LDACEKRYIILREKIACTVGEANFSGRYLVLSIMERSKSDVFCSDEIRDSKVT
jgi:hypothetical protein